MNVCQDTGIHYTNTKKYKRFIEYHNKNPKVFQLFVMFAKELVQAAQRRGLPRNKIRISHWLIANRIRWEVKVNTTDYNSKFKLNNNYIAYYARVFEARYPKWIGLFEKRKMKN